VGQVCNLPSTIRSRVLRQVTNLPYVAGVTIEARGLGFFDNVDGREWLSLRVMRHSRLLPIFLFFRSLGFR